MNVYIKKKNQDSYSISKQNAQLQLQTFGRMLPTFLELPIQLVLSSICRFVFP